MTDPDYRTLTDRVDAIGFRTRELDRPVADQARLANRALAAIAVLILTVAAVGFAYVIAAEASEATHVTGAPHLAMILAAGGGGATGAVGMLSTLGGVVYLTVFCVNAGHMAYVRWHKGRDAARQTAAKWMQDERHGR